MRHVLGVMGVLAASVLLVVSAMMNYQFGYSLGRTPTDSHIYGMASAAADCFKALAPFFFFAAIRNRVWSQALAAALVWVVVTGYAFTSALGHAALNRFSTSGERVVAGANYQDLRDDRKQLEKKRSWIPAHRPPETVKAEIGMLEAKRAWILTNGCTDVTTRSSHAFCDQYRELKVQLANGVEAQKLDVRIAEISNKIGKATPTGAAVMGEADPQAGVISRLTGLEIEHGADQPHVVRRAADRDRLRLRHVRRLRLLAPAPEHARRVAAGDQNGRGAACAQGEGGAGHRQGRSDLVERPLREHGGRRRGCIRAAAGAPLRRQRQQEPQAPTIMPPSDVQRFYKTALTETFRHQAMSPHPT